MRRSIRSARSVSRAAAPGAGRVGARGGPRWNPIVGKARVAAGTAGALVRGGWDAADLCP